MRKDDAIEWIRKNNVKRIDFAVLEKFVEQAVPGFLGTDLKKGIVLEFPDRQARTYFIDHILPWEVTIDSKLFGKDGEWDPRGKIQFAGDKYIVSSIRFYKKHIIPLMPKKAL